MTVQDGPRPVKDLAQPGIMANYWTRRTSLMQGGLLHDPSINQTFDAGWSSPVARQAHNLKVVGSNPTPATKFKRDPLSGPF